MKLLVVVSILVIVLVQDEVDADIWRRRRRRCQATNCAVSGWGSWTTCNHRCGTAGVQSRTRAKTRAQSCGGTCSYSLTETQACNRNACKNGGTPAHGRCLCGPTSKGTCCEQILPRGPPGPQGPKGLPGKQGNNGLPGAAGKPGSGSGTVFTRWGRTDCPSTSRVLYKGVMGGSHNTDTGGGSNYLCLPLNPIYENFTAGSQGSSYIFGTEYEINLQPNIFPKNVHNHDAPCAVCHAESRGNHMMIPARNVCPGSWTLEYKGYLMSEQNNNKGRTQFICVDANPTAKPGTHGNDDGALLYFVESYCGSLPCLPYVQGKELTCAVCTK